MQESAWSTASLTDCVENLSSYTLTTEEHQLLGLGLAFALPPRPETCADVITAIQHLESYARDIAPELRTLKGFVLTGLQHLNKAGAGLPRRLRVALQSLRTNSSVIILKADKGNRVVVMDKSHYLSKAFEMLADTNVYELLRKNPIESEQASYNNEVRRIYESMPAGSAPYRFIAYLPTLAHLYLNPKIHKDPVSFRPIVSQAQSFTKPLS